MHMFFSALVTRTSQQPTQTPTRQTTLDACMQNFEFQHYITWGWGLGEETARYFPKISAVL